MSAADLNEKIVRFCRRLRDEGIKVSQAESSMAIQALNHLFVLDKEAVYYALRSVLCFSPEEYKRFDRVFKSFFGKGADYGGKEQTTEEKEETYYDTPHTNSGNDISSDMKSQEWLSRGQFNRTTYQFGNIVSFSSDEKLIMQKFQAYSPSLPPNLEDQLRILLKLLKQALATDFIKHGKKQIHFKKTMRKNIQYGGEEFFKLYRVGRSRQNKLLLITLADISGSMEHYFRLYLPLLYRLHRYAGHAEVILFNTSIYRQTHSFRLPFAEMIEALNQHLHMVAKGTNLGQSIKQFNHMYKNHMSPELTTVLIFSDGWDRGNVEVLKQELSWLSQHCFQIIWLNPLLGSKGYVPLTRAFETAAPYITHMVSAQDYQSLS